MLVPRYINKRFAFPWIAEETVRTYLIERWVYTRRNDTIIIQKITINLTLPKPCIILIKLYIAPLWAFNLSLIPQKCNDEYEKRTTS